MKCKLVGAGVFAEAAWVWPTTGYARGVCLYELGHDPNRAQVFADWTIELFTRPDTSKLFEDSKRPTTSGR